MNSASPSDLTERLRLAVRAGNVGLWDWDLRTNEVFFSPEWKRQLGHAEAEIGNSFAEWESRVHPDDLAPTVAKVQALIANPVAGYAVEFRMRHKDGGYRWILAQADILRDESGQPARMLGSHIDITERKRAEAALREREQQMHLFVEHSPAAIAMFDRDMRYLVASRRWVTGYRLAEQSIIGRSHYEVFPEIPDRWKEIHRRCLAGAVEKCEADPFPRADGTTDWVRWEVRPWQTAQGEIGGVIVFSELVTERKQAEAALRESDERLRIVTDHARVGLVMVSPDRHYLFANAAYAEILGLPSADLVGKRVPDVLGGVYEKQIGPRLDRAFAGERVAYELQLPQPDSEHHYAVKYEPIREGDVVSRVVVVIVDITERKRAEEALREREEGLRFLFEHMLNGFAYCEMLFEQGRPSNYRYLMVNRAFETQTGLRNAPGKRVSELIPGIQEADPELFEILGRVAATGQPEKFEIYLTSLQAWFAISAYSPKLNHFVAVFDVITQRKQAEQRAAWLASYPERNPNPIVELDLAAGSLEYVNPSARKAFPGLADEGLRHPFVAGLREWIANRADAEVSHREVFVGTTCYAQTVHRLREVGRVRVYGNDITRLKLAEAQTVQSEERIRTVFHLAPDGIALLDARGQFVEVNEHLCQMQGYSREELLELCLPDLLAPEELPRMRQTLAGGSGGPLPPSEWQFRRKDGTLFPVEVSATFLPDGGQLAFVRDISGRKQSEAQQHLHAAALSAAANEIVITDRAGVIQWVNPAFTQTTGYTLAEAVGQNPRVLKSGRHDHAFYHQLWATILRGEVWRGEMVNRKKDGSLFTEEAIITPVKDERGEITHFIAIKQDISEKKLLEAKFLRAQRLEGLGALAGGVAHDLNNVLAPILMASELLKSQATDPQTRHLLEMIEDNSQRGAGMIRQILAFARGTAGEKIVLQAGHLLKDISKMMKETFPPNIRCELRVAGGLEPVLAESTELYQVLLNLCVNARDAMPKGGTITLGAENVRLDETYARLSDEARPGHYVILTVADTGGGIPPEIRGKIFEPFFTTKEPGKGTGLGLATVKDIVTGHGGFIHLYSELGVGTQFKIFLPVAQGEEAAEGTAFLSLPAGHGELVLVVDDAAAVREIVKSTLEGYGYRVVTAGDGTEAVARFVEHLQEVQLLLTDIQMPHMDGMALIRALRNIQPGLRVIAASGLSTHEAALKATGLEVQGFIPKPFTAASLLLALDAALHPK